MNDLQRTNDWYLLRKGMITASQISALLGNHKEQMTEAEIEEYKKANPKSRVTTKEVPFSQASFTYLDGKIAERFMTDNAFLEYQEQFGFENAAMRWGTFWEDKARAEYEKLMGLEVEDAPFIELDGFERFAGGSPDGIVKGTNSIVEFKCPANPAVHLKHFLYSKPQDLKEDNDQYYAQCQYNMLCAASYLGRKVEFCDFVSYDPRTSADKQIKVLRLYPDEDMQKTLLERTARAVEYEREQIKKIKDSSNTVLEYEQLQDKD